MADIVNVEMAKAWDGAEGAYWADNAASYERTTRRFWGRLREQVPIAEDERAIDIGCGNGAKTCDLARVAPFGSALGIDLSRPMLENARRRAAANGVTNVQFVHGDAQAYPFEPGVATLATRRCKPSCALVAARRASTWIDCAMHFTSLTRARCVGPHFSASRITT